MTKLALIAPSSAIQPEDPGKARVYFENLGFEVVVPDDLLGPDLLCANQDAVRLKHLKAALTDPSVDVIWMLRGGYGLTRLIPSLMDLPKPEKQKLFVGFSDATVLHLFLNQVWDWPSLHAPVVTQIVGETVSAESSLKTLEFIKEGLSSTEMGSLHPLNSHACSLSGLEGKVVGGNLTLAAHSLGTPYALKGEGKILFFEDWNERGYRLDRMLTQLAHAGVFQGVKAVLLGDFMGGEEGDGVSFVEPVLQRFGDEAEFPVFRLPSVGHGAKNYPLPFQTPLTFLI